MEVRPTGARLDRRKLIQVGSIGALGLSLAKLEAAKAAGKAPSRIRSCILVFYYGGPSHLDTWDLKPDAPSEVRGEFSAIPTSADGIRISQHLPHMAKVMHHAAIIRSMHHPMRNHNSAAVEALCGRTPLGGDQELLADTSLSFPCYGSLTTWLAPRSGVDLPHVALPHVMRNVVQLPGQTAGFLGSAFEPLQVESDPNSDRFDPGRLTLPAGMSADRLSNREDLLRLVDRQLERAGSLQRAELLSIPYSRAFTLLRSQEVRRAFDLSAEPETMRRRYGRNRHGQSVLLARRLVEAGARFITVFDGIHNGQEANWDSHQAVFARHRDHLLPPADQALGTLIADLNERGLLDETLVVAMGEFGRTPKINRDAGRDHWPDCYSIVLAGGGVKGGTVHGASDAEGAYPASDPVRPGDLAATLFWRFGLDFKREMRDGLDRPYPASDGEPIRALFSR